MDLFGWGHRNKGVRESTGGRGTEKGGKWDSQGGGTQE